ncbi:Mitochondrial carnitine/acylcarnitine carrier-like protein [Ananas comosus]|uniref:Mitochondrial carnitine/acylcarnitine carrier-like protein n=1 Tax=Ananas comosus TaxID=4615 RepID=A0A199VJ50_ANACO|nr:Mitochondrial carnitine/acylcarnitine carrier-like protein [Ananas comosus]
MGSTKKMANIAKDLTAGTVGGAAQLIVGHPFDTIKVKLQSQPAPLPGQLPNSIEIFTQHTTARGDNQPIAASHKYKDYTARCAYSGSNTNPIDFSSQQRQERKSCDK